MKKVFFILCAVLLWNQTGYSDSLWRDNLGSNGSLFTDDKACVVGDIVTIVISEQTSANRSSETSTDKDVSNTGQITDWLYPHTSTPGFLIHKGDLPKWDYEMAKEFTGKGAIKESDTFTAKITARVIDVLPNGNLLIEGSRELSVANDKKKIIISGIVRQSDITDENTVDSNLIADAKIYYEGKGPLADNQKRGFFTWLRDVMSMF